MKNEEKQNEALNKTAVINWFLSLQFIFRPDYWLMNEPYSKEVDEIMNELLERYEFTDICENGYTAKLGNALIWTTNAPYGAIRFYESDLWNYRPSRLTIKKALHKLKKQKRIEENPSYKKAVEEFKHKVGLN